MFQGRIKGIITESFTSITAQPASILESIEKQVDKADRNVAEYLWAESFVSESINSKDARYRIITPTICLFESELESSLLKIKKDLEPLWNDRDMKIEMEDNSLKIYSDSL